MKKFDAWHHQTIKSWNDNENLKIDFNQHELCKENETCQTRG